MTREEAVTIIIDARYGPMARHNTEANACAHAQVREYVRLGIIKLDEPKSVNERAWEVLRGFTHHASVIDCLHRAGLKIVEKE